MLTTDEITKILQKLHAYPVVNKFLRNKARKDQNLNRNIYGNSADETEYTIWNIILHSHEPYWSQFLYHFNTLIDKHSSAYRKSSIVQKTLSNVLDFVSELEFLHALKVSRKLPIIEPKVTSRNLKNTDFAIQIQRRLLIEIITPRIPKKQAGFAPKDFWISGKFIDELEHHFGKPIESRISEPFLMVVDGAYRGLNAVNAAAAFDSRDKKVKNISGVLLFRRKHFQPQGQATFVPNTNCHRELIFTKEENKYFRILARNFWNGY